jgi:hypothetical protein
MSRQLFLLLNERIRENAMQAVWRAPTGTRVEIKDVKRTLEQNAKMWALLTDVASQKEHCGRYYSTNKWKALFMHACGQEVEFLPSLDGETFIPLGYQSSDLTVQEMSTLIEFIISWGAQNGVVFHDCEAAA